MCVPTGHPFVKAINYLEMASSVWQHRKYQNIRITGIPAALENSQPMLALLWPAYGTSEPLSRGPEKCLTKVKASASWFQGDLMSFGLPHGKPPGALIPAELCYIILSTLFMQWPTSTCQSSSDWAVHTGKALNTNQMTVKTDMGHVLWYGHTALSSTH